MSVTESKAVISVTADTKQAVAEINKLAAAEGKRTEGLKKQADSTGELGKKWEELSKSMVGLQLHDAFKRVSDGAKEATNGVVDLNLAFAGYKVAGPWGAAVGAVGVAAFKAAEQFSLMKGRLGELVEEVEKRAGPEFTRLDGPLGKLTQELYRQEAAILRNNVAWVELPRTMSYVFQAFANVRSVLKDVDKDIKKYDESLRKTGLLMLVRGSEQTGRGVRKVDSGSAPESNADIGLYGDRIFGALGGVIPSVPAGLAERFHKTGTSNMFGPTAQQSDWALSGLDGTSARGSIVDDRKSSFLEKSFGPLQEFDAYAQGFQMLSGAVGASLGAWIDGSMSAGEAFKKFIGEALKALAVQMAVESLKHGAYALGSLAFGDIRGASQHGAAAGAFGIGALFAGGAAKAFGGGGGPSGPGSSAKAPNVSGGSGGGGGRNPERVIVYSDPFAESTARERQLQAEKLVSKVYGNSAVVNE